MAVTVPSTDTGNYQLQAQVAAVQALVTAAANPAVQPVLVALLDSLQQQLVASLMANANARTGGSRQASNNNPSFLTASGVLSAGTINT